MKSTTTAYGGGFKKNKMKLLGSMIIGYDLNLQLFF